MNALIDDSTTSARLIPCPVHVAADKGGGVGLGDEGHTARRAAWGRISIGAIKICHSISGIECV